MAFPTEEILAGGVEMVARIRHANFHARIFPTRCAISVHALEAPGSR
jgi:hypothetical protein